MATLSAIFVIAALNCVIAQINTYTFTPCGATGRVGPTQAQVGSAYANTNLSLVTTVPVNSGIQTWTVPPGVSLIGIEAWGASGGTVGANSGGSGARMKGEFNVVPGTVIYIVVGQTGLNQNTNNCNGGGGGGGTFVYSNTLTPMIVAGGGGGGHAYLGPGGHGTVSINGSANANVAGVPGANGAGGASPPCGSGWPGAAGGGWTSAGGNGCLWSGNPTQGGQTYPTWHGGLRNQSTSQGTQGQDGSFGAGGGAFHGAGGGGGYSGGGAGGSCNNNELPLGGGGGSYNGGTNQNNSSGVNIGNGKVVITELCFVNVFSTSNPICAGNTVTLTTDAVSNYSWSNGSTASSIVVTPNATTNYSIVATSTANCSAPAYITVTVSPGLPVLSVTSSTTSLCLGKTATLTASGALTYTWTNGVNNGVSFTPTVTNTYTVTGQNGCGTTTAVATITVAPLAVSVQNTPTLTCSGQSSTLTASAAATSYTWQPFSLYGATVVVNPTVSTVFTVTASDGTCSGVANLTLNTLPVPTINIAAGTSVVCSGNTYTMSASGGLSYTWNPGNLTGPSVTVSPTAATLYSVVGVNSVGCTSQASQIVLTETSPNLNVTGSSVLTCPGDPVTLIASGNSSSYQWVNGPATNSFLVNPLVTTIYTVSGAHSTNSCTTTKSFTVSVLSATVNVTSSSATVCSGSTATLSASGADTYQWDNSVFGPAYTVTPNITTVYTVAATTSSAALNCTQTKTIQINVNPNPTLMVTSTRTTICINESTDLVASGAQSYTWTGGSSGATLNVSPPNVSFHSYTVTGTDANGCQGTHVAQIRVIACNSIRESGAENLKIFVYPNPSNGTFTITGTSPGQITIVNLLGQEMYKLVLNSANKLTADLSGVAPGVYFIRSSEMSPVAYKLIVE